MKQNVRFLQARVWKRGRTPYRLLRDRGFFVWKVALKTDVKERESRKNAAMDPAHNSTASVDFRENLCYNNCTNINSTIIAAENGSPYLSSDDAIRCDATMAAQKGCDGLTRVYPENNTKEGIAC